MAKMAKTPEPLFCLQHSKFTTQDGWKVYDLSLSLSGHIAVSGGNENTMRTFISIYNVKDSDSRDEPKVIYCKEFEVYSSQGVYYFARLISFVGSDDSQLTSCLCNKLELFDVSKDEVLGSRLVDGRVSCIFGKEREILINFFQSNRIAVYDTPDLKEINSIILQGFGIEDGCWPIDFTVVTGRFFVCVGYDGEESNHKSLVLEEKSGKLVSELTKPTGTNWFAHCIEVCASLGVVAVVWCDSCYLDNELRFQVVFYSLLSKNDSNFSFLKVEVEFGVLGIRISDRGDKLITWNKVTSEVKVYDMAEFFNYDHFKENLALQLQTEECSKLADFFALPKDETDAILQSVKPTEKLLLALENAGVIQPHNVERLTEAFVELEISLSCYTLVDFFQKTRLRGTLYDRFLATLSAHLTSSLAASLCKYFDISEEKTSITTSQNPGLSFLLALDEKGVIKPSAVVALEQPFTELNLVQALAKVHEYQSTVDEEINQLKTRFEQTEEGKREFFIQCLRSKIKSWYETLTPVPWKKSCRWTSLALFVGSGLVITESKATGNLTNVDEKCKLQYNQILTHDKLKTENRIILEGEPGSGKTMMSSQIAYDWSQGKMSEVDGLILLPLKFVNNVTLVEAIKRFYFPTHDSITVHDIESFLTNPNLKSCLILDGLEEYNSGGVTSAVEPSEVVKIMEKSKYPNCKVILTSRLDYANDLPPCPMLRIGRFGETERNTYIEKLFVDNTEKQQAIKRFIENTPFILDLCSVPLLFVLAVHNIESMEKLKERQLHRISPFIENVIEMLCSSSDFTTQQGVSDLEHADDRALLEEFAYNGLCKGRQILSWRKDTLERNIPNLYQFIESGILVVEEGILKGKLRSVQNEKSENVLTEKNKKQDKTVKEKDAVGVDVSSSNSVKFKDAEASL
ncbi:Protein NLRC5 [Holothuria leucospilota]|uniref:Protein NLRC5 n=1 Tax=Holothuria leucospilota TaxID=206669 RepID=A0A9Q1BTX7_HOLLE|nr:Protein NLRC5 [Holothuria leucospilota]